MTNSTITVNNIDPINGRYLSAAIKSANDLTLFPNDKYENEVVIPLQPIYPLTNDLTFQFAHHRVAYPGMRWQCPVRCNGGVNPRVYDIHVAPTGMTLGFNVGSNWNNGFTVDPNYGLLTWDNPVIGEHLIVIRCADQSGAVTTIKFTLLVSTLHHLFVAPTSRGDGTGSSYANAMGESTAILNASTHTSTINKVMVLCGGEYPSVNQLYLNKDTGTATVIGYPNEVAIFKNRIKFLSSDCTVGFLTIKDVGVSNFGVIYCEYTCHRLSSFYNSFEGCLNTDIPTSNNQAVHGFNSASTRRNNLVFLNNTYIDCHQLHAEDLYSCDKVLIQCEKWITTSNPTLATQARSVWFPKARCDKNEISFNVYDNPHVSGRAQGIIQTYNGVDGGVGSTTNVTLQIEYNFIRCSNSELAVVSNGASNLTVAGDPFTLTNYIRRNTFINGGIASKNYDYSYNINRRTFLSNNVVQTSSGLDVSGIYSGNPPLAEWFSNVATLYGTNLINVNGTLNAGNISYKGSRGAELYEL